MRSFNELGALLVLAFGLSFTMQSNAAAPVSSAPVSFNFVAVPLTVFAQATYKNLLGRDYVISPDLVALDKRVTINVKSLDAAKLPAFVDSILNAQGITSKLVDGVYFLDQVKAVQVTQEKTALSVAASPQSGADDPLAVAPKPVEPDHIQVYRPRNRTSEFMALALNAAFSSNVARSAGATLVLAAPIARMDLIVKIADALDIAAKSVEVSASFVEVTRSDSSARGISLVSDVLSRKFGVQLRSNMGVVSINAGNYQLVIEALQADGRFKQVSNSRVVGDESERMSLSVGDETPTIASNGKDNQGNSVQNVVYRPSGVILDVLPRVLGSGSLSLTVDGQVSSFQPTTTGVTGSPTMLKRQVKTSVSMKDGQVIIIGGLDDSKLASSAAGYSFIPSTWRNKTSSDMKTELVLILSAKVFQN